jgi:hypothetical protein
MGTYKLKRVILIAALGLLGVGCAPTPVVNVTDAPVVVNKPGVTLDEVGKAIVRAGATIGFQMIMNRPGLITGTYSPRGDFTAVVEVKYSTQKYSINYKDSQGLNYDGTNIHRNYNNWVLNLDRNIKTQLSTL